MDVIRKESIVEKQKILIVDDRKENLIAIQAALADLPATILTAQSGNDALALMLDHAFSLLLLDVQMPEMDGFELAELTRGTKRTAHIPIIFITAINKDMKYVFKGYETGAVDYIFKPIEMSILKNKVSVFLDLDKQRSIVQEQAEQLNLINHKLSQRNGELEQQIRERKEVEKALEKAVERAKEMTLKAEQASNSKSNFLANVSHEIRTPMNAILGFSEVLDEIISEPLQKKYISNIRESGKTLIMIINEVLDLSKIEAGRLKIEYNSSSVPALLNSLEQMFSARAGNKGIQIIVEHCEELPESLLLDEFRLRQIMINLIGNAIKFTDSGYIKIRSQCTYQNNTRSRLTLSLSVEDTGNGIPKDQQELIFLPFEQKKGQSAEKYGGSGLGLAICKKLTELMGGCIELKSEEKKGTTFTIHLNNVEVAIAKSISTISELDTNKINFLKAEILVADDIQFNKDIIHAFLSPFENLELREVENGKELIEAAREQKPDLILIDMKMPVMDGYEASRIIKNDPYLSTIPVIAITASGLLEEKKKIQAITDSYLCKPISKTDLIHEIMNFLPYESVEEAIVDPAGDKR